MHLRTTRNCVERLNEEPLPETEGVCIPLEPSCHAVFRGKARTRISVDVLACLQHCVVLLHAKLAVKGRFAKYMLGRVEATAIPALQYLLYQL